MTSVFSLPAKFRVNKTLSKEYFIQNANLTKREAEELNRYVNEVIIQYVIEFSDKSQLIFIEVEIGCYYEEHTFQNIARILATAIPHCLITIIRYQERVKIAAFNSRENMRDSYRKTILNYSCSPYFNPYGSIGYHRSAVRQIESIVNNSTNAITCNKRIIGVINSWKDNHFEERKENRRCLYLEDKLVQLQMYDEFEQEDRLTAYDTDDYEKPDEGYDNMSFEEKNYLYHFSMHNVKEDEELRRDLEESFLIDSYLFGMDDED